MTFLDVPISHETKTARLDLPSPNFGQFCHHEAIRENENTLEGNYIIETHVKRNYLHVAHGDLTLSISLSRAT